MFLNLLKKKYEIAVNFDKFQKLSQSHSKKALDLAKICERISKKHGISVAISPQFVDLQKVKEKVKIPVFTQHIDPIEKAGAFTDWVIAENLKAIGIDGTLINHSERKLPLADVKKCVEITREFELISICYAATVDEGKKIAEFNPDFIAIEPPELIGTGISVSKAKPEIVTSAVEEIKKVSPEIKVLCGAGITTGEDVKKALELGSEGILVASGVVKAENPKAVLEEFAKATKSFIQLKMDLL